METLPLRLGARLSVCSVPTLSGIPRKAFAREFAYLNEPKDRMDDHGTELRPASG